MTNSDPIIAAMRACLQRDESISRSKIDSASASAFLAGATARAVIARLDADEMRRAGALPVHRRLVVERLSTEGDGSPSVIRDARGLHITIRAGDRRVQWQIAFTTPPSRPCLR